MFVIKALPKTLACLTWLSLSLTLIAMIFSIVSTVWTGGVSSFFLVPSISFASLLYLVSLLIIQHRRNKNLTEANRLELVSRSRVHSSTFIALPSVILAYLLGILWFVGSVASMVLLAAIQWHELGNPAMAVVACYASTVQTVIWFGFAGTIHRARTISAIHPNLPRNESKVMEA
ncbi:hypothetical protein D9757_005292 [Collybiopsis confluens]|uniref:Uncharacterized protein n=1 Tax=Collybiopsis confluens TaxID=2823264 RepID=A0A8H5MDX4_9AGAR|nr:hypothetical protein D9757_005292 [Collybiopsis confluens]